MGKPAIGVIGLAVMGRNLALNIESRGYTVAVYNRSQAKTDELVSEFPDRKLVPAHSLVHTLVAAANEEQLLIRCQAAPGFLIEPLALGRKQHDALRFRARGQNALDGVKDRFGFEEHTFATAERPIVHGAMTVMRPGAEVVDLYRDQAGLRRFGDHPVTERAVEKLRKDGEDMKSHWCACGARTRACRVHTRVNAVPNLAHPTARHESGRHKENS